MSAQFGVWNFDGEPVQRTWMERVCTALVPYGPDAIGFASRDSISIGYCALCCTSQSRQENQPYGSDSGVVITWDGRLDNRAELISLLDNVNQSSTDVEVVAAAYDRWGTDCFPKLMGDWAVAIWNNKKRTLILAKDPVGTRPLYYSIEKDRVQWSTILDPLVLFADRSFSISEEYVAGCLSFFPGTHLTPYVGIHSVLPCSFTSIREDKQTVARYWDFDPDRRTWYRSDADYEEHFRALFAKSVQRRLRSDSPILAELSGGMDSSSIVCMADVLLSRGIREAPRLDTVSYYDPSEKNWNEWPYFSRVEAMRGRTGFRIDVGADQQFAFGAQSDQIEVNPCAPAQSELSKQLATCLVKNGNRVILSGIGGDEVLGGVPTPTPELEDLLARAHFRKLAHQLKVWALQKRKPWLNLLFETAKRFFPPSVAGLPKSRRPAPWLDASFVKRNLSAFEGYEKRIKLLGALPSFQENLGTLEVLRRQLACSGLPKDPPHEKRYPYLDRELLEFLFSIPREQVIRPGQRRSLMRRALAGIVPEEVLNRKSKGFISRSPRVVVSAEWNRLARHDLVSASLGIVDPDKFFAALQTARLGQDVRLIPLIRTIMIELWLRSLSNRELVLGNAGPHIQLSAFPDEESRADRLTRKVQLASCACKSEQKGGDWHEIRETGNCGTRLGSSYHSK